MKKKFLGVAGLAALLVVGLTSCGTYSIGKVDNKDIDNLKDVIKENYDYEKSKETEYKKDDANTLTKGSYTKIDTEKYTTVKTLIDGDLVVVENEKGYQGVYSLVEGKFLIKPQYYKSFINYSSTGSLGTGKYICFQYGGKYDYYDSFGNVIAKGLKSTISFSTQNPVINDGYYFKTTINDKTKYLQYKYSDNGKLNLLDEMPKDPEADNKEYKKDDLYFPLTQKIKYDDKEYTVTTVYVASNAYIYIYDSENKLYKSFEIPYSKDKIVYTFSFDNGEILVQIVNRLPDDSKDYSYSVNNVKYKLTSVKGNIFEDDTFKEIDLPYVATAIRKELKDKDGNVKNMAVTLYSILEDKILGPARYYLLSDELKLTKELTFDLGSMYSIEESYFDDSTDTLYDAELNAITYISSNALNNYNKELKAFLVSYDGKYGLVDTNGKVIVPFEYKSIDTNYVNSGKVYATNKDDELGILDTKSNTFTSLKGYLGSKDSLYIKTENNSTHLINLCGSTTLTGTWTSTSSRTNWFTNKLVMTRTDENTTTPEMCTITLNEGYFKENGTELTDEFDASTVYLNAKTLNAGDNNNVAIYSSGSYFKFTTGANKTLTIKSNFELVNSFDLYNENGNLVDSYMTFNYGETYDGTNTIYSYSHNIENAGTYIIKMRPYSYNVFADLNISFN